MLRSKVRPRPVIINPITLGGTTEIFGNFQGTPAFIPTAKELGV